MAGERRRTARRLAGLLLAGAAALGAASPGSAETIGEATSLERLLADAEADRRALRLTSPPGNNALERYRRVLALDPDNERASNGLLAIVRSYIELADDAIERDRFDRAGEYLDRAETVLPANELVAIARADLERARARAARSLSLGTSVAPAPATGTTQGSASASAPSPTPAPGAAAGRARTTAGIGEPRRHRLAIFPFESIVTCYVAVGKDERTAARRYVEERPDAELVWSYYESGVDERAIPPPSRLWTDNQAKPVPRGGAVAKAARGVGADTVLMVWYLCSQSERMTADTYAVVVFVVDENGRTLSERRRLDFGPDAVRALLAETWDR